MSEPIFIKKNERTSVGVSISDYNEKTYLHIRDHYLAKDGTFAPTRKGIAIEIELATDLLQALTALVGTQTNKPKPKRKAKATTVNDKGLAECLAAIPAKTKKNKS